MTSIIGHLHPMLVHLPIGILLLAFVMECLARWFQQVQLRPAIHLAIGMGLAAAAMSALSGWMLAEDGGYDPGLLQQHRWLGVGTLALFALVWLTRHNTWYFSALLLAIVALIVTGHFGGSLTHGDNYLFGRGLNSPEEPSTMAKEINPETPVFADIIQPILKEKCGSCHRSGKRKGDLVLLTPESILAGGKHGQVLIAGNPDSSAMLQRLHLALHHDDHMPPSGKPQLSDLEIGLLTWWIANGADFKVLLKDKALPPDLLAGLTANQSAPKNPVFAQKVSNASPRAIERLQALRLNVQSLGTGQPWLAVSFAGQQVIRREHWEALDAIAPQLVDLDLSHTALRDQDLSSRKFPNLIQLNLSHTTVGYGALSLLQEAVYLESLNLTNTMVDEQLEALLPKLSQLKRLFLWKTNTTTDIVASWKRQYPNLQIETGATPSNDLPLTLNKPKLLYGRTFFEDTMHLELSFPFKGVDIYYTVDDADMPGSDSPKYQDKIILDKTSHVRAFAAKEGWENSPIAEAVFVKKKFAIAAASLAKPASPKYPANGATSLIDGKIADAQGADTWLGFEGEHLKATLDLGEAKAVGHLFVHCLENNSPWIFKPIAVKVSTSLDGKNFKHQSTARFKANAEMGEQKVHLLACHFPAMTEARYISVTVESPLRNPPWHPGKGQKCWIFVDEITVE